MSVAGEARQLQWPVSRRPSALADSRHHVTGGLGSQIKSSGTNRTHWLTRRPESESSLAFSYVVEGKELESGGREASTLGSDRQGLGCGLNPHEIRPNCQELSDSLYRMAVWLTTPSSSVEPNATLSSKLPASTLAPKFRSLIRGARSQPSSNVL